MLLPFFYVAGGRPLDCMLQHLKMADFYSYFVSLLNMKKVHLLMRSIECLVYTVTSVSFLGSLDVFGSLNTRLYILSGNRLTLAQVSSCTHRYLLCLFLGLEPIWNLSI